MGIFRFTRGQKHQGLTATAVAQSYTFPNSVCQLLIKVSTTNGVIRIGINGEPAALDGDTGFLIKNADQCIQIQDHVIDSLQFIRETSMVADIAFDVLGLSEKENA